MARHRKAATEVNHKPSDTRAGEPGAVRIGLLGGFHVSVGARPIGEHAWRLRKAASLVKLLALARDHRLHREQAMDVLWPGLAEKPASNNLRQALHAARRILDPVEVASENGSLFLGRKGSLWVDVDAFEEAVMAARRTKSPSAYRAAIEQYSGELLPEERQEVWIRDRREELRRLYLALLLDLATIHEEREEPERGIEVLGRALSEDPQREETHADLMRLYALCGNHQEAILQYERLKETIAGEPSAGTRRLYQRILDGSFPEASASSDERELAGEHNLPVSSSSFVGRGREIAESRRMLSAARLLTLTGAGGSGKTRMAIEVARGLAGDFPDGVRLAELAPISEPALVPQAVTRALGTSEQPGRSLLDTLIEAVRDKELLLVVDNCEHLIQASASLAEALLSSCPRLRILATSREPLAIAGEVVRQVGPLSLPEAGNGGSSAGDLIGCEAVRLFVDRARDTVADFMLTERNADAVVRVCRKLDGIPLALELAAAQTGALPVEQIARKLEWSLDLLRSSGRTAEPKQQTLRATLDWSHKLLDESEKALFGRLSVFAGGWTLEAAEQVGAGSGIGQYEVLDLLSALVDKSLVVAGTAGEGTLRYGMLEPIRQYAREKLEEIGDTGELQARRAAFFLTLAEEAEPELDGPRQGQWVERLEGEHDNLREALSWALERGEDELALRLAAAVWRFWFARGYFGEGAAWLEQALAAGDPAASPVRVKAIEGIGWIAQRRGDTERAEATYQEMLGLSRTLDDKANVATALNSLGILAVQQGDHERATPLLEENMTVLRLLEAEGDATTTLKKFNVLGLQGYLAVLKGDLGQTTALWEECLTLAREVGDTTRIQSTLSNLGYAAVLRGNHERATTLCEEALLLAHQLGSAGEGIVVEPLINLGLAARARGEYDRSASSFAEALAVSRDAENKPSTINALEGIASLAAALERDIGAARLWGAAGAARDVTGLALLPAERKLHEPYLASSRSRLGEGNWEETSAEGRAMSLEEATEYALNTVPPTASVHTQPQTGNLTRREREVALLAARGLTNRQISTRLSISERTAGNHVAKILRKLGLRSRAQIAAQAGIVAAAEDVGITTTSDE